MSVIRNFVYIKRIVSLPIEPEYILIKRRITPLVFGSYELLEQMGFEEFSLCMLKTRSVTGKDVSLDVLIAPTDYIDSYPAIVLKYDEQFNLGMVEEAIQAPKRILEENNIPSSTYVELWQKSLVL